MVVVGVIGICLFAEMSGRVAAVSGRATFEIIRERLGPRAAGANLTASFLINLLTLTAEVGGIALALQLASSVEPRLWIPVAALALWLVVWRTKFSTMENVTGLVGSRSSCSRWRCSCWVRTGASSPQQAFAPPCPPPRSTPSTGTTRSPCSAPR